MTAPTRAEVNLAALRHNIDVLRKDAGGRDLLAVVKAGAYGHGAIPVSRALEAHGVGWLGVATLPEALELREAGITARILVFGGQRPEDLVHFSENDLDLTVTSGSIAEAIATSGLPLRVHLQVDTGMERLGLLPPEALQMLGQLDRAPGVTLAGVYTHLADPDHADSPLTRLQMERWHGFIREARGLPDAVHVGATGAVLSSPDLLEGTSLARPGIAVYGIYDGRHGNKLQPVMSLISRIARIRSVEKGTRVSYGGRWEAPAPVRIATIAAGYADGVHRALSNKGQVGIAGHLHPIAGTVCMDMTMVAVADPDLPVREGDPAVFFGRGGPDCRDVARRAGTISWDIVCGVSARVPRVYRDAPGA